MDKEETCVICYDGKPNNKFGCGHDCVCDECRLRIDRCPLCRYEIDPGDDFEPYRYLPDPSDWVDSDDSDSDSEDFQSIPYIINELRNAHLSNLNHGDYRSNELMRIATDLENSVANLNHYDSNNNLQFRMINNQIDLIPIQPVIPSNSIEHLNYTDEIMFNNRNKCVMGTDARWLSDEDNHRFNHNYFICDRIAVFAYEDMEAAFDLLNFQRPHSTHQNVYSFLKDSDPSATNLILIHEDERTFERIAGRIIDVSIRPD